ncbi:MAG: NAD-dependent epimerase/dehydratase family protein [Mycobacterium sp.]|nr:NAD-dependent epimerase/dehydratase family protein [Mycobacterium sp.]
MTSDGPLCLVTGATGYIGSRLVPVLLERGMRIRVLARTPAKLAAAPWRDEVDVVRGDLTDPASLDRACADGAGPVDVVYHLVHAMGTSADFAAAERQGALNVAGAARRHEVGRIVYLGGLHPDGGGLSRHLQSRTEVGHILSESGVTTMVLQAGVVIGAGSAAFEMIRQLCNRLPVMTTPRWVHNKIQPIAIDDVLHYLAGAATAAVDGSRTWDIGGPDVLEYGDMMQVYTAESGRRRRMIVVLPWLTPTIASLWVGLVTPIPPGLARPLVESLHCDAVVAERDIDAVIAPPAGGLTPYRRAVQMALNQVGAAGLLPSDPAWAG